MLSSRYSALIVLLSAAFTGVPVMAGGKIEFGEDKFITIGAGLRTGVTSISPDGGTDDIDFSLQSMRLYIGGQINENVKMTFNTARVDGEIDVLDAIAQFEFSEGVNLWIGKMLAPSSRIEMNGPYYALTWNQYTQPLFAQDQDAPGDGFEGKAGTFGRDDGVTFWGSADKFQYAIGLFDGFNGVSPDSLLLAARFAYNFLAKEQNPAYYTSSTYYGGLGDIFTVALTFQTQSDGVGDVDEGGDFTGTSVDVFWENAFDGGSALTVEAEFKTFDSDFTGVGTVPSDGCGLTPTTGFCLFDGDSYFVAAGYLFPKTGKVAYQPYVRFVSNEPSDAVDSDLTEAGINFVIDGHNARLNLNFSSGDANITGFRGTDTDTVSFNVQLQL